MKEPKTNCFKFPFPAFLLVGLVIFACGERQGTIPPEIILARVGEKTISVDEFKRRTEYTIRPAYCRGEHYVHRKIALNSLIAEKLLVLEADSADELTRHQEFHDYLRGRKEQAMRQWHFYQEAFQQARPDTAKIQQIFKTAGRKYDISFFNVRSDSLAKIVEVALQQNKFDFEKVGTAISGDTAAPPRRTIRWGDPEHDSLKELLFARPVEPGQILGPLRLETNRATFIKINGWTNQMAFSENQQRDRWNTVSTQLREQQAVKIYETLVKKLMAGKQVEFNPDVFKKLVNLVGQDYFKTEVDKQNAFNQKFWDAEQSAPGLSQLPYTINDIRDEPLFKVDATVWTVRDCENAMRVHPLVFRKRKMPQNEFAEQFKLAIVDMVRDQYITEDAYQKAYDRMPAVQRNFQMWRDNLLALYHKQRLLKSVSTTDPMEIVTQHLDPHVQTLFQKYAPSIEINTDAFEEIQLTHIDMFAIQRNMPFPVVVPGFPQLTTYNKLDYGTKMQGLPK